MKNVFKNGFWAILASAAIYGSYGVLVRISGESFGVITQTTLRGAVAILAALVLAKFHKSSLKLPKKIILKILLLGLVYFFATMAFTYANQLVKVSVAVFMLYVGAFITSFVWGTFLFKEKLTVTKVVSLVIVILGLLFTIQFNVMAISLGALFGILCGFLDATANSITKTLSHENKDAVVFYKFAASIFAGLVLIPLSGEVAVVNIALPIIIITIVFGLSLVLVNNLLMTGFKNFDFTLGQIVLSSEIFFATIFGIIFFAEMPTWFELVGGVLIFVGATLVNFDLGNILKKILKK